MTAGLPDARDAAVEVVRSEQRLVPGVERRVSGRVRVAKRVVTEERSVTVTVRREELVVEHLPAPDGAGDTVAPPPRDLDPAVTLVLSEEVPQVTVRTVPRERVRVHVDRITSDEVVTDDVALERVDVDVDVDPAADLHVDPHVDRDGAPGVDSDGGTRSGR
jgi:uncharacterized protein (TIGR02271 family)